MRTMILSLVVSGMLCSAEPEVSLNLSRSQGRSYTTTAVPGWKVSASPDDATSLNLRFGAAFTNVGAAELVGQVTIHSEVTTTFGLIEDRGSIYREGGGKFKNEGLSLGLQTRWRQALEFGFGGEVRYEHLTLVGPDAISTGQYRPWLNAYLGRSFRMRRFTSFLGIEVAAPLTRTSKIGLVTVVDSNHVETALDPKDVMKSMSPRFEWSLVLGLRK